MVEQPGYPAARSAAVTLERYFARLAATAAEDTPTETAPDADAIEAIIDAAFWASLRREEGYSPKISLALMRPEDTLSPLRFERPLALAAATLARVAPAVERPGIHLAVSRDGGELRVWGTTRDVPKFRFVLEVIEPGLLVVKHRRTDAGKYVNVLVLQGDRIRKVDETASTMPDCPPILVSLLGFHSSDSRAEGINVLVELAVSMRSHQRGGSLLIVPSASSTWQQSVLQPMAYGVMPPFSMLAALLREPRTDLGGHDWHEALDRAIEMIGGLTAVDGATIVNSQYDLLGFGAKLGRRRGSTRIEEIILTEPFEGNSPVVVHPAELGGTRHLSAAQFVLDQPDTLALVASQDGRFTIFAWSPCEDMVHAHRVESLLL